MATKTGGKTIFGEKCQFTLRTKIFIKITLSSTISKITPLECFMYNFKMAAKNSRKTIFSKNCQNTTHIKPGGKIIHQNHSISHHFRDKCLFMFMQKYKMAPKLGRKMIFGKHYQTTVCVSCRSKSLSKSLYLALYPR